MKNPLAVARGKIDENWESGEKKDELTMINYPRHPN